MVGSWDSWTPSLGEKGAEAGADATGTKHEGPNQAPNFPDSDLGIFEGDFWMGVSITLLFGLVMSYIGPLLGALLEKLSEFDLSRGGGRIDFTPVYEPQYEIPDGTTMSFSLPKNTNAKVIFRPPQLGSCYFDVVDRSNQRVVSYVQDFCPPRITRQEMAGTDNWGCQSLPTVSPAPPPTPTPGPTSPNPDGCQYPTMLRQRREYDGISDSTRNGMQNLQNTPFNEEFLSSDYLGLGRNVPNSNCPHRPTFGALNNFQNQLGRSGSNNRSSPTLYSVPN